jgi:hypothetical protein
MGDSLAAIEPETAQPQSAEELAHPIDKPAPQAAFVERVELHPDVSGPKPLRDVMAESEKADVAYNRALIAMVSLVCIALCAFLTLTWWIVVKPGLTPAQQQEVKQAVSSLDYLHLDPNSEAFQQLSPHALFVGSYQNLLTVVAVRVLDPTSAAQVAVEKCLAAVEVFRRVGAVRACVFVSVESFPKGEHGRALHGIIRYGVGRKVKLYGSAGFCGARELLLKVDRGLRAARKITRHRSHFGGHDRQSAIPETVCEWKPNPDPGWTTMMSDTCPGCAGKVGW